MSFKFEVNFNGWFARILGLINKFNIGHLLLLSFGLHLFAIASTPDSYVFDEAHYIPAARATMNMQAANLEHMPLVKVLIALTMKMFGDWWFSWRLPIVFFSVASLLAFYLLSKNFMSRKYALLATSFLSFDVMFFIHGSIFVLDMPALFFGLLGLQLYFAKRYKWMAVALALSFLMKELGLFFMFTVVLYHFAHNFRIEKHAHWKLKGFTKKAVAVIFMSSMLFTIVGGGGLWIYDLVYKPTTNPIVVNNVHVNIVQDPNGTVLTTQTWTEITTIWSYITNPVDHLKWAWSYFTTLVPAVETPDKDHRPPWGWIMPYGDVFNSPHYLTVAVTVGDRSFRTLDWIAQINPLIAYGYLPFMFLTLFDFARKKGRPCDYLYSIWGIVSYLPWLLDGMFFQRMTFNYYFLYTIPAICLGWGWFYSRLGQRIQNRTVKYGLILGHLALIIIFFLYFFPLKVFR